MKYSGQFEMVTYQECYLEITAKNVQEADDKFSEIRRCLDDREKTPDPDLYTPEEMDKIVEECYASFELSHDTFDIIQWSEGGL